MKNNDLTSDFFVNDYNKALEIDCNCVEALIEKRQVLIELEHPEELVEIYDKMIEMFPEENEKLCFEKIKLLLIINASKDVEGDKNHENDEEYESGELSVLGFSESYSDNE